MNILLSVVGLLALASCGKDPVSAPRSRPIPTRMVADYTLEEPVELNATLNIGPKARQEALLFVQNPYTNTLYCEAPKRLKISKVSFEGDIVRVVTYSVDLEIGEITAYPRMLFGATPVPVPKDPNDGIWDESYRIKVRCRDLKDRLLSQDFCRRYFPDLKSVCKAGEQPNVALTHDRYFLGRCSCAIEE